MKTDGGKRRKGGRRTAAGGAGGVPRAPGAGGRRAAGRAAGRLVLGVGAMPAPTQPQRRPASSRCPEPSTALPQPLASSFGKIEPFSKNEMQRKFL